MGLFDLFKPPSPEQQAVQSANEARRLDIEASLRAGRVPVGTRERLEGARLGRLPWMATLTAPELSIVRSHGLRPIACVSANCWYHYGVSWTLGHAAGWEAALRRLREEARAAGANAVLDVKMRTVPFRVGTSMDFMLIGTAVWVDGLAPSREPVVATVPALEFVKLLEADVVPTGIAIGAHYEWLQGFRAAGVGSMNWLGNVEVGTLSKFFETVRRQALAGLRQSARGQGNGVLAHVNFSQLLEQEVNDQRQYLCRHIVIATTVEARRGAALPHEVRAVVDMCAGPAPLRGAGRHHQAYGSNEREGGI